MGLEYRVIIENTYTCLQIFGNIGSVEIAGKLIARFETYKGTDIQMHFIKRK